MAAQANHAGVDDALMLDMHGFVSETNATNFFIVRKVPPQVPLPVVAPPRRPHA